MMSNKEYKASRLTEMNGTNISASVYNLILGLTVLWGAVVNIFMAATLSDAICSMNYILMIVIYFIGSLGSMAIVYRSKNPIVSFLGFTGLSASMGLLLTYFVSYFEIGSILLAFMATGVVTIVMIIAAVIFPDFFKGLGRVLCVTLLVTIIAELILSVIMGIGATVFDFIVVIIFCGYVGYDWVKAQEYPKTIDNAIDSAADIYVDIVNLFVRILSIIGDRD